MGYEKPMTGAQRVAKRRAALRAEGLKPKTFWVPDLKDEKVRAGIMRECEIITENNHRWNDDNLWIEAMINDVVDSLPPWIDDD